MDDIATEDIPSLIFSFISIPPLYQLFSISFASRWIDSDDDPEKKACNAILRFLEVFCRLTID